MKEARFFLFIAALMGFLAVGLGAFGAHGLKNILSEQHLQVYQTAVQYQFYHTFALLAVAVILLSTISISSATAVNEGKHSRWLRIAGWCFIVGIVVFSGSLYVLVITGMSWLGMITPLGGACFLLGWLSLAVYAFRIKNRAL